MNLVEDVEIVFGVLGSLGKELENYTYQKETSSNHGFSGALLATFSCREYCKTFTTSKQTF